MYTLRQMMQSIVLIAISSMLAGCTFGRHNGLPPLTAEQEKLVAAAQRRCASIVAKNGNASLVIIPVVAGRGDSIVESHVRSVSLGDEAILKRVFSQRLCLLEEVAPPADRAGLVKLHQAYDEQISEAVSDWPMYDAVQYPALVSDLQAKKKARNAKSDARFSGRRYNVDEALLLAAIPYFDFLHVRDIDVGFYIGSDVKYQKLNIGRSAGKVCLSREDFSIAVRPALDQTRAIVIGLGLGKYDEAQALQLILEQVYDTGAQRLVVAREANGNAAPVQCAPTSPTTTAADVQREK